MPIAQSSSKSQAGSTKSTKQMKAGSCEYVEPTEQKQQPEVSNTGTKTPPEQPEFVKQTLIIIEKKVRNLDKRRIKLEEYKETARKGGQLNEDQLNAVAKFDEVIRTLELTKEMEKQFVGLANDTMKQQKKQLKKEQIEREELLKEKLRESHRYLSLLDSFGDETIRTEFLAEVNGSSRVTEEELKCLDEFNKLVELCAPGSRLETVATEYADHLCSLIEGRNKPIATLTNSITYNELKKLFERLLSDSYWTEQPRQEEVTETVQTTQVVVETTTETSETQQTLNQAVENLQLNEQQQVQQNDQAFQNVDDFVIVSSSECAESLCHSKASSVQPQQVNSDQVTDTQKKTFFTTLNQPTEQRQNINEFINSCENNGEGLNFFQDSELQARQVEQQQNEMNFQGHPQENNFNQQPTENQKDQGFKQQRGNNRQYQPRRHPNGNGQPRNDNRGPRNNNGYRGGNNSGPRGDSNGQRGGYRGQNGGRQNNGYRGNYQQQQQQSQMA